MISFGAFFFRPESQRTAKPGYTVFVKNKSKNAPLGIKDLCLHLLFVWIFRIVFPVCLFWYLSESWHLFCRPWQRVLAGALQSPVQCQQVHRCPVAITFRGPAQKFFWALRQDPSYLILALLICIVMKVSTYYLKL